MEMVAPHNKCYPFPMSWNVFSKSFCDRFDQDSHFFGWLTKLRKIGTVKDYMDTFEKLAIETKGLSYAFYLDFFIGGLKEAIQAFVWMHHHST